MKKRAISALMAATMVWAAISVPAFADNDTKSEFDAVPETDAVQGEHAAIGGVDTKEHKEHFRVAVPVEKNIYTFTVDPEKNGKITALVTAQGGAARTVYFDRHNQTWFGTTLPTGGDVTTIGTGWQFSNKSDFMVVTNIGSVDVQVGATVDAITPNPASVLTVAFEKYYYNPTNLAWTPAPRPGVNDPRVWNSEDSKWYFPSVSNSLPREGATPTGETVASTAGYKFWHVVDETTYFNDNLVEISEDTDDADHVTLTAGNLGNVYSVAFQVVAEASGKGWSENQQARIMMEWSVTSRDAILPRTLDTKYKVDAAEWSQAKVLPVNMGEGSLEAESIAKVYMVYGPDNTEVDLGAANTSSWYSVKYSSDIPGANAELIISALAMQNIKAADKAEGGWIPVMFKVIYNLAEGGTAESYVWLY